MTVIVLAERQVSGITSCVDSPELVREMCAIEHLEDGIWAASSDDRFAKFRRNDCGTWLASLGQQHTAAEQAYGGYDIREVSSRLGDRHPVVVGHRRSVPTPRYVHKNALYSSYMTSPYKTETRHHPEGKTCHHFTYHWLTCDEYDALRARANGHCEICGVAETETKRGSLVIDHYTTEGLHVVRGLLCDFCNTQVMRNFENDRAGSPVSCRWEAEARAYVANSWHQVTPEILAAAIELAEERARRARKRVRRGHRDAD